MGERKNTFSTSSPQSAFFPAPFFFIVITIIIAADPTARGISITTTVYFNLYFSAPRDKYSIFIFRSCLLIPGLPETVFSLRGENTIRARRACTILVNYVRLFCWLVWTLLPTKISRTTTTRYVFSSLYNRYVDIYRAGRNR